jgi:hypothetical protein
LFFQLQSGGELHTVVGGGGTSGRERDVISFLLGEPPREFSHLQSRFIIRCRRWALDASEIALCCKSEPRELTGNPMSPRVYKFQARIYRIWMMRHVSVPEDVSRALESESRRKKHIPVVATVNGKSHRTTLVPAGGGHYRLQIHTVLRKAAEADTGDLIGVSLRYDAGSREVEMPEELAVVLEDHPKAATEFQRLPPGHRRQLLLYYLKAQSPKAREHVTARFIDHLLERAMLKGRRSPKPNPPEDKD